jgi:hypothetical protein
VNNKVSHHNGVKTNKGYGVQAKRTVDERPGEEDASVTNTSATLSVYDGPTLICTVHLRTMMRYALTIATGKRLRCTCGLGVVAEPSLSGSVRELYLLRTYLEYKTEASLKFPTKNINETRK